MFGVEKYGCPVAQEILLGNQSGDFGWQLYISDKKMAVNYGHTTNCQSWAITLRTMVAQWATESENDNEIMKYENPLYQSILPYNYLRHWTMQA